MKLLIVAHEPRETRLAKEIAENWLTEGGSEACVYATDFWQYAHSKSQRALDHSFRGSRARLITNHDIYRNPKALNEHDFASQLDSLGLSGFGLTSRVLANSAIGLNAFERSVAFNKPTEELRFFLLSVALKKVNQVMSDFGPSLILCIGRESLFKYVAFLIGMRDDIHVETIIQSRSKPGSYMLHDKFGIGQSERLCGRYSLEAGEEDIKNSLKNRLLSNGHLYSGPFDNVRKSARLEIPKALIWQNIRLMKCALGGRLRRDNLMKRRVGLRLTLLSLQRMVRVYMQLIRPNQFDISVTEESFFLYPLHARPEASTLVLGKGTDDEEAIRFICKRLPIGVKLVVKENPTMAFSRSINFYKELRKLGNVVLLPNDSDTLSLIENSRGVIGISGTALLEAKILGVPCHVLGDPEFSCLANSQGWDDLNAFLSDERKKNKCDAADSQKLCSYLKQVEKFSFSGPLLSEKPNEVEDVAHRIVQALKR